LRGGSSFGSPPICEQVSGLADLTAVSEDCIQLNRDDRGA
jgi:hypothetical protein